MDGNNGITVVAALFERSEKEHNLLVIQVLKNKNMATEIALQDGQDFDRQKLTGTSFGFDTIIPLIGQEIDRGRRAGVPRS